MRVTFYVGMFMTLLMLNAYMFMFLAKKLDSEYSSTTSLMLDSAFLSLGIVLMYYGILG